MKRGLRYRLARGGLAALVVAPVLSLAGPAAASPPTVSVVGSVMVAPGDFGVASVSCPAGATAIGGGIDLDNVLTMVVTSSAPTFGGGAGTRLFFQADGPGPSATGWQASARNNSATSML